MARGKTTTDPTASAAAGLSADAAAVAAMGYEEAVAALESIIDRIERGEIGLEGSLAEYRRGVALVRHCKAILDHAQQQVRELSLDEVEGLAAAVEVSDDEAGADL
jgi:exodeoxyribonuclease VII small subunit